MSMSRRFLVASLVGVVVLLLGAACSVGGGSKTPTATTAASVASPPASATAAASPTHHASPVAGSPVAGSPTAGSPSASPTIPATPTRAASPTATRIPEAPIGEVQTLDPEKIPNFSMTASLETTGIGGSGDSTLEYVIQQSSADRFHLKVNGTGTTLEIWKIGDQSFIAQSGGEPAPLPEGTDTALFSPTTFLQVIPPIDAGSNAQDLGAEKIDGRPARHYRLAADDFLKGGVFVGEQTVSNAKGQIDIWIDDEFRTPLRQQGDLTWTNADGSDGRFKIDYQLTQIGSTPEIQPPTTP